MKPSQRLSIVIIGAALLPVFAIVWARVDESAERSAEAELRLVLQQDITLRTTDATHEWLREHEGHAMSPLVRRVLQPGVRDQFKGAMGLEQLLKAVEP